MPKRIDKIDFMVPDCKTVSELNMREHWAVKNKRKKNQQELVAVAMLNALRGRKMVTPCTVTLTRIAPRRLDEGDNLSSAFKGIRDQISRQLGVDDGGDQVKFEYAQMPIGVREYGVKISIVSTANLL